MTLQANMTQQAVYSNEMRYKEGRSAKREYDSCYYEIVGPDPSTLNLTDGSEARIYIEVSKMTNMNVYIYGGPDRFSATEQITKGNQMPVTGRNYSIPVSKGVLVVAYPNQEVDTEFEFKYWVDTFNNKSWSDMLTTWDFTGEDGDMVFLIFCIVAAIVLIIVMCCLFCCCKRCM